MLLMGYSTHPGPDGWHAGNYRGRGGGGGRGGTGQTRGGGEGGGGGALRALEKHGLEGDLNLKILLRGSFSTITLICFNDFEELLTCSV